MSGMNRIVINQVTLLAGERQCADGDHFEEQQHGLGSSGNHSDRETVGQNRGQQGSALA